MSFLRGKSTSFTRFALPEHLKMRRLDEIVQHHEFTGIPDGELDANGFCSYRNLLDASIDRGLLDGHTDLWLTGLRRDVKKAPAALVAAQTARELADMRTTNPNLSKQAEREVKAAVRLRLNLKAQPRPAHAAVLFNFETGMGYVDGIASAHEWLSKGLDAQPTPYAESTIVNAQYLAWCAWRAGHGVDTPVSPSGDITFREPKDAGAAFDGQHNIDALLDYWMGEQRASIASLGLVFAVEHDEEPYNVDVTLQAAGLKVCALEFPEQINEFPGTLDERLALRLGFLMSFERALADDYKAFAELAIDGKLPEEFNHLISTPEPAEAQA